MAAPSTRNIVPLLPPAAGGTVTLATAVTGIGAVIPAKLALQERLQIAVAGTGAVSASLVVSRSLQVGIAGIGAVTAALAVQERFQVAIAGTGALAADVARQVGLVTAMTGVATVAANITVTLSLGGFLISEADHYYSYCY